MNGISSGVELNSRLLQVCKENPDLSKCCKWSLAFYPTAARPLLPLGGSILMLKKMLLERLQVPFTPGVPKASPEAFEFGLTSVTPSRTRCAWWGVWRAECYRITARSWEQGVVELAPITLSLLVPSCISLFCLLQLETPVACQEATSEAGKGGWCWDTVMGVRQRMTEAHKVSQCCTDRWKAFWHKQGMATNTLALHLLCTSHSALK